MVRIYGIIDEKRVIFNALLSISDKDKKEHQKLGIHPVEPILIKMVADTGSSITCISESLINHLLLKPVGSADIYSAHQNKRQKLYHVNLDLLRTETQEFGIKGIVSSFDSGMLDIDGLLGWDVLQHTTILYSPDDKEFYIEFKTASDIP